METNFFSEYFPVLSFTIRTKTTQTEPELKIGQLVNGSPSLPEPIPEMPSLIKDTEFFFEVFLLFTTTTLPLSHGHDHIAYSHIWEGLSPPNDLFFAMPYQDLPQHPPNLPPI